MSEKPTAPKKRKFPVALTLVVLLVSYAVIVVGQLWFSMFSWELFTKISITYGVVIGTVVIVFLVMREMSEEDEFKKDNYLD